MFKERHPLEAGMIGSFAHLDCLEQALWAAKAQQMDVRDVYSPVPVEKAWEILKPQTSPVRFGTFVGGLLGAVGGLTLCILTSVIWNIVVAGKPVTSHVPFMVVTFEALVLLGAFGTLFGMLIAARLPFRRFPTAGYRPEFSEDHFGIWLSCPKGEEHKARQLLEKAGAVKVFSIDDNKMSEAHA